MQDYMLRQLKHYKKYQDIIVNTKNYLNLSEGIRQQLDVVAAEATRIEMLVLKLRKQFLAKKCDTFKTSSISGKVIAYEDGMYFTNIEGEFNNINYISSYFDNDGNVNELQVGYRSKDNEICSLEFVHHPGMVDKLCARYNILIDREPIELRIFNSIRIVDSKYRDIPEKDFLQLIKKDENRSLLDVARRVENREQNNKNIDNIIYLNDIR